jgi:hypothetical protein
VAEVIDVAGLLKMTGSVPNGFARRMALFLNILFWVALMEIVWEPVSLVPRTAPGPPQTTRSPSLIDLRFPTELEPAGNLAQAEVLATEAAAPPNASVPAKAPSGPSRSLDPAQLRRVMDRGVAQFASAKDDAGRSRGANLVQVSALLGYSPARELVVRNYLRSPAMQSRVPEQDAVRFTVELMGQKSEGIDEVARALGNEFAQRGEATRFARHMVDAISDDDRLHSPEQVARLLSIFARIPGVCGGIWQAIGSGGRPDDCSASLNTELLQYVTLFTLLESSLRAG